MTQLSNFSLTLMSIVHCTTSDLELDSINIYQSCKYNEQVLIMIQMLHWGQLLMPAACNVSSIQTAKCHSDTAHQQGIL